MLDAPDTSASRPGLRLRVIALVVVGLFALLGLRLWALTVLQAPAAAQAVTANQIRVGPDRAHPGADPRPLRQSAGQQRGHRADHPVPGGGRPAPRGGGPAGRPHRADHRPGPGHHRRHPATACTSRCRSCPTPRRADILYINEHQDEFPGVTSVATTQRNYPQLELPGPAPDGLSGVPDPRLRGHHQQRRAQVPGVARATRPATPSASRASSTSTSRELRGTPGQPGARGQPRGPGGRAPSRRPRRSPATTWSPTSTPVSSRWPTTPWPPRSCPAQDLDPQCNNNAGCYPAATGGAVVVMDPQTGAV